MARSVKIFGDRLRQAREAKCLTQSQLGEKIDGMSDENIGRIEREDGGILSKKLPALATALGLTVEQVRKDLVVPDERKTVTLRLPVDVYDGLVLLAKNQSIEDYLHNHVLNRGRKVTRRPKPAGLGKTDTRAGERSR